MKKTLAMLLCMLLLVTPIFAGAQTTGNTVYLRLSNPYIQAGDTELDLADVELDFSIEEAQDGINALINLAANAAQGNYSFGAFLTADNDGIIATLSGMQSAAYIPMDFIKGALESVMQEIGGSNPVASAIRDGKDLTELIYDAESIAKLASTIEGFVSSVETSEPVASTITLGDGTVVPTQQITFNSSVETNKAFVKEVFMCMIKNPIIEQSISTAADGMTFDEAAIDELLADFDTTVAGTIDIGENGMTYTHCILKDGDDEAIFDLDFGIDADGTNVSFSLYSDDDYADMYLNVAPNDVIATNMDVYFELSAGEIEEDGSADEELQMLLMANTMLDDNGIPNSYLDIVLVNDESSVEVVFDKYSQDALHGGFASLTITDEVATQNLVIGYDGTATDTEITKGDFYFYTLVDDVVTASASLEVALGTSTESIAHDFSNLNKLNITAGGDEALQTLSDEAMNALQTALLGIMANVPALASLLG